MYFYNDVSYVTVEMLKLGVLCFIVPDQGQKMKKSRDSLNAAVMTNVY